MSLRCPSGSASASRARQRDVCFPRGLEQRPTATDASEPISARALELPATRQRGEKKLESVLQISRVRGEP
jgi:hypothetical protein